jgi:hypothetical protein
MPDPNAPQCDCGWLENAANDPTTPVAFDQQMNEYYIERGGDLGGQMVIYHCPFCGGSVPKSKREALFETITAEEMLRLRDLTAAIVTVSDVLSKFGPADEDNPAGHAQTIPEDGNRPAQTQWLRSLRFNELSPTAVVEAVVYPPDTVHFTFYPKARKVTS